jgi:small subunit ribosomal protein S6
MISNYEFTVIFDSSEDKTKEGLELLESNFAKYGVEVTKKEDMGVKTLAYLINKQEKGHYFYYEIKADGASVKPISRALELSYNVLKYLFINPEKN